MTDKDVQKSVLITGCSSGIGLVAANDLLARGYRVLAACRRADDVTRMDELGFTGIQLDLDDPASVDAAADRVLASPITACTGCSITAASASTDR